MDTAEASIAHLRALLGLAEELADNAITLYSHEYRPLSFGSFSVEFGRPHFRVLCLWDGKESRLSVCFSELPNQTQSCEWIHDAEISVSANDVYAEIGTNVLSIIEP